MKIAQGRNIGRIRQIKECMHAYKNSHLFEVQDDVHLGTLTMSISMEGLDLLNFVDRNFLFKVLTFLLHFKIVCDSIVGC